MDCIPRAVDRKTGNIKYYLFSRCMLQTQAMQREYRETAYPLLDRRITANSSKVPSQAYSRPAAGQRPAAGTFRTLQKTLRDRILQPDVLLTLERVIRQRRRQDILQRRVDLKVLLVRDLSRHNKVTPFYINRSITVARLV